MAFPPPQKSFGSGQITIHEVYSIHDVNKLISSIAKDVDSLRIGSKEMKTSYAGEILLTDNTISCGQLKLEYNRVVGIAKEQGVFATFETTIDGKYYKMRLQISSEKSDDLFRFLGNRIGARTVSTDTKFAKGVGRFFKDRFGFDLNK